MLICAIIFLAFIADHNKAANTISLLAYSVTDGDIDLDGVYQESRKIISVK